MMKVLSKILFGLGLVCSLSSPLYAAESGLKIGVIDMRSIISNSPQAKAAMEKLKSEFKAREEKIVASEKSYREKAEKLQRNSAIMSEAEKSKLEKEVIANQRELQRMQAEFREDAAARQQEEMKKLIDKIDSVVQAIAKKENYDLIIHSEVVPYAAKQMNITDTVLKSIAN